MLSLLPLIRYGSTLTTGHLFTLYADVMVNSGCVLVGPGVIEIIVGGLTRVLRLIECFSTNFGDHLDSI